MRRWLPRRKVSCFNGIELLESGGVEIVFAVKVTVRAHGGRRDKLGSKLMAAFSPAIIHASWSRE